uniref:Rad60-SLD_2 domain-containing protein n=1 Tax=Steinernema glaseri TaxID=37863 RepID=A0A1I7ZET2_9BILA
MMSPVAQWDDDISMKKIDILCKASRLYIRLKTIAPSSTLKITLRHVENRYHTTENKWEPWIDGGGINPVTKFGVPQASRLYIRLKTIAPSSTLKITLRHVENRRRDCALTARLTMAALSTSLPEYHVSWDEWEAEGRGLGMSPVWNGMVPELVLMCKIEKIWTNTKESVLPFSA